MANQLLNVSMPNNLITSWFITGVDIFLPNNKFAPSYGTKMNKVAPFLCTVGNNLALEKKV